MASDQPNTTITPWQPIETRPEHVTVLLFSPSDHHYNSEGGVIWVSDCWPIKRVKILPTHWRPLPPSPWSNQP